MNKLSKIFMATALSFGAGSLVLPAEVFAQSSATVGAVRGVIRDKSTGEPALGATVVATSPALVGEQVVLTDESGQYFMTSLAPGVYTLTIYYENKTFSRGNVLVQLGKEAVVNVSVDPKAGAPVGTGGGETIVITGTAPTIDQGSTKTGVTITDDYTRNIPTGRTFGGVVGSAAGAQDDLYGVSIAGATSSENVYVVEGINTTDTGFGGLSTNLPNEFIAETEVITGGYNAEFGRATGGIINVVTKSGSNEFRGSVFGYYTPGSLVAEAEGIQREGGSIDTETNLDYRYDVGAEVGGPIIKDKLWFHVGFNPSSSKSTVTRTVARQIDVDADGVPDIDPDTGFTRHEPVSSTDLTTSLRTYFFTAKINGAINQNNQFQVSAFGNPRSGDTIYAITRNPANSVIDVEDGAYDLAAKWTSKFNDGKTQVDAVLGFHRGFENQLPKNASQNVPNAEYRYTRSLYDFNAIESQYGDISGCQDSMDPAVDPYPGIRNCPVFGYSSQGLDFLEERTNDRTSAVLAVTQRVKLAGYHTFKAGLDLDFATYDSKRGYSGGARLRRATPLANGQARWQFRELLQIVRPLTDAENQDPGSVMLAEGQYLCANDRALCQVATNGITAETKNTSVAAFIQDSWQIRPNLTLNAGLRWEQQTGFVAEALQGQISPEGEIIPEEAYKLENMFAPRIGLIYDPTSEGKSKIFAHWGRFYENVPMDINVRAFGGEITNFTQVNFNRRTEDAPGFDPNCNVDFSDSDPGRNLYDTLQQCTDRTQQALLGGGTEYVSPGLKGQYTQELVLGAEYEILPDLTVGMNYIHRTLPVVIEDVSVDGGNTYMITNPGEDLSGEAAKLQMEADRLLASGDPDQMALGELFANRADQLSYVGRFDKPTRNYDALQLTARQRATRNSLVQASYTFSQSKGNYPGLFSTETGQLDPNLTSLYDLPDLMANRYGAMGLDRPHNLKVDGFYLFNFKEAGMLTTGVSFRAQSGIAHNALASHPVYGSGEAYLLPRGAIERSPVTTQTDVHLSYGYQLNKTTRLEGFVRLFNLFNQQEELDKDEIYTFDNAIPVVGGDLTDLQHVKVQDPATGLETDTTVTPNPNFKNVNARQAPRSVQLGFRLTF
ncbi:MAG: TonB-dependent receptor [Deltaproteobacteria bacterium]|nr:TonB-dependent receptor [Deltaproteobacteria bacterium]